MDDRRDALLMAATAYFHGDPARVQHFWKVWAYAALMGRREGLDASTQETLEAAAIVHDVGIRVSERKYGSSAGPLQEKEGPPEAERLLRETGYGEKTVARVAWLVGHHHTYDAIDRLSNPGGSGFSRQPLRGRRFAAGRAGGGGKDF